MCESHGGEIRDSRFGVIRRAGRLESRISNLAGWLSHICHSTIYVCVEILESGVSHQGDDRCSGAKPLGDLKRGDDVGT